MAVPDGYNLFERSGPPVGAAASLQDLSLRADFLRAAERLGFDTASAGFRDCEETYFLFFGAGREVGKESR